MYLCMYVYFRIYAYSSLFLPYVRSLALHPGQQGIVATGQVGNDPLLCVWDTAAMHTISILHGAHTKGIAAVSFGGPDGKVRNE